MILTNGENNIPAPEEAREINLLEYWGVIWKRRWLIAAIAVVLTAAAAVKTFTQTPIYTASGTLLIERELNLYLTQGDFYQPQILQEDYYQTQYRLLRSRAVAERTVDKLGLVEQVSGSNSKPKGNGPAPESAMLRRQLAGFILGSMSVSPIRMTRLVSVSFSNPDPKFAAEAVNAIFESFIDLNIESKSQASDQATEFLTQQISSLRTEIAPKERALQVYGAQKNIIALSDKETTILEKLGDFNKALTAAQLDRISKEAYYSEIKNATPEYFPETLANPLIQRLRQDYAQFKREYTKKSETFKPNYPEMQRLKAEIESARSLLESETKNLIKAAQAEYQAALQREKSLLEAFNKQKAESIQLNSDAISYNSLKIELQNRKDLLDQLLKRQSETGVSARLSGLRTANARVIDLAETPLAPSSPNKKRTLMLALFLGLFGGLGMAFLLEYLDHSVKTAEDVEKTVNLPVLGIVAEFSPEEFRKKGYGYGYRYARGDKKNPPVQPPEKEPLVKSIDLITVAAPKSGFSESYRSIRTAFLLSGSTANLKAIILTSPLPLEGKSANVCNFAVTLAQAGKKVLILDADLRKPRQHRIFGIKNLHGLTNHLTAGEEMKELIKATRVPNVFMVNAGPVPPNPSELLGSEKMAEFMGKAKAFFDFILIDTPPVLAVSDALVLGPLMDAAILIVWSGKTPRDALKSAKEKLDMVQVKTLGVIINHESLKEQGYYHKKYYYTYSHYGEG